MTRPTKYTPELARKICEQLSCGRSPRAICREDENMPTASTILSWLSKHYEFAEQYARTREAATEAMFWEMIDIADDGCNDTYIDDKGQTRTDHDVIARSKLRVDIRKWALARMAPKKYGEKAQLDLTSKDGTMSPANMSDEEMVKRLNAIHSAAKRRMEAAKAAQSNALNDGSDLV